MQKPAWLAQYQFPRLHALGLLCNVGLVFCAGMVGFVLWGMTMEYEKALHKPATISEADVKLMVDQYNRCKAERIWEMSLKDATGIQYKVICSEDRRFEKP